MPNPARPRRLVTLGRSAIVGALATGVDLVALFLLVHAGGLDPTAANLPALALGLAVQFIGNKVFAFEDKSRERIGRQLLQFAGVEVITLALNAIVFHLLVTLTPLPYLAARVLGQAVIYCGVSYPLWTRIFARPAPSGA